jgi:hypothetical protein
VAPPERGSRGRTLGSIGRSTLGCRHSPSRGARRTPATRPLDQQLSPEIANTITAIVALAAWDVEQRAARSASVPLDVPPVVDNAELPAQWDLTTAQVACRLNVSRRAVTQAIARRSLDAHMGRSGSLIEVNEAERYRRHHLRGRKPDAVTGCLRGYGSSSRVEAAGSICSSGLSLSTLPVTSPVLTTVIEHRPVCHLHLVRKVSRGGRHKQCGRHLPSRSRVARHLPAPIGSPPSRRQSLLSYAAMAESQVA